LVSKLNSEPDPRRPNEPPRKKNRTKFYLSEDPSLEGGMETSSRGFEQRYKRLQYRPGSDQDSAKSLELKNLCKIVFAALLLIF
jgi:hypothetical protein